MSDDIDTSEIEGEPVEEGSSTSTFDEEQLMTDLNEGLILVRRAKTLLDYIANPKLCPTIEIKERKTMIELSSNIEEFIDVVDATYGTVGMDYDLSV